MNDGKMVPSVHLRDNDCGKPNPWIILCFRCYSPTRRNRSGGEPQLLGGHWQQFHAVLEQPREQIRAGHKLVCAHPSIPKYFMLTAGETVTYNDLSSGTYSGNNIVRQLILAEKTWKVYVEGLPHAGYIEKNPHYAFTYFTDVRNSSVQRLNIVPFTQFKKDLGENDLPNYVFIVPDHLHNALDGGTLSAADAWLKTEAPPLLNNSAFKEGGVMIVVFDEGDESDRAHGGGHIAMVMAGPNAIHTKFTGFVQHPSLLKLTCSLLELSHCPGMSATAPNITGMIK